MSDRKRGDTMSDTKMGRPTDTPRPNRITIRLSNEEMENLDKYCEENATTRTDVAREGIQTVINNKK